MADHDRFTQAVTAHYGHSEYGDRIRRVLEARGADLDALTVADLGGVDHLHAGGKHATLTLAHLAGLQPGFRVADLGGGAGGPARTLASEFGCSVDVVDLTEEFCRVGAWLTGLTHLQDRVRHHHRSALATGLEAGAYDAVWMQNSAMNIEDRPALYAEVARLLKPGGLFAFQEVMLQSPGPVHYPVNWAGSADTSFLFLQDEVRRMVVAAGLTLLQWSPGYEDPAAAPPPPGAPRAYYNPDALIEAIAASNALNRDEGRVLNVLAVFRKAPDGA